MLSIPSVLAAPIITRPGHAAGGAIGALSVFVGYAEDKETNNPNPAAFPVPWAGAPNTTFLGGPVPGQTACGTLPLCYDAGAIRLDNRGSSDITIGNVTVDDHSSLAGGKVFNLWGSFTVPAGKSVILTENPPNKNPSYDNFDTSGYPKGVCTPISIAPTITVTIGGVPTVLVDSRHVLDTGGIDLGSCQPKQNESIQWRQIGTAGVSTATLTLSPASIAQLVGQQVTATARLLDGSGQGLPNATVNFSVTNGPDAGLTGTAVTDYSGNAQFTVTGTSLGTDTITASVTTVGTFQSNATSVSWTNTAGSPTSTTTLVAPTSTGTATAVPGTSTATSTPTNTPVLPTSTASSTPAPCPAGWSCADIGNPPLAGSQALNNGIWTIVGEGTDIGGTADQFHFVWQPLATDGGISTQVITQTKTNDRARAGVMLRLSTDPSAPFYAAVMTPGSGLFVLDRATQGGGVSTVLNITGTVAVYPIYLQVQRAGTTFTASTSSDGTSWTPLAGSSVTLNALTGTLLAGMAVTSHTSTTPKRSTATFSNTNTS